MKLTKELRGELISKFTAQRAEKQRVIDELRASFAAYRGEPGDDEVDRSTKEADSFVQAATTHHYELEIARIDRIIRLLSNPRWEGTCTEWECDNSVVERLVLSDEPTCRCRDCKERKEVAEKRVYRNGAPISAFAF